MAKSAKKYRFVVGIIICLFVMGCSGSGTRDDGQIDSGQITPRPGVKRFAPQVSTISQIYEVYQAYEVYQ